MRLKKIIGKVVTAALLTVALPTAVFAAAPNAWVQRYDVTVIAPGGVANYVQRYRINIVEPVHLSLTSDRVVINATPNAATPDTGKTVVLVTTQWPYGYLLYMSTPEGNTSLVCKDDSGQVIPALVTNGIGAKKPLEMNTWGFGLGLDTSTPPNEWLGAYGGYIHEDIGKTSGPSAALGDAYNVFFGVRVDMNKAACEYVGTVTFTALAGSGPPN